ncbi:hypothetical protein [Hyphomonas atlantica corrig.]|uniref:hypothetical protein n=1 Tax=Hyphomonas atlantica TaxID=1280948 RepID=UPI0023578A8A|nr:hypothetical protein [Hyphomonas atlantica]
MKYKFSLVLTLGLFALNIPHALAQWQTGIEKEIQPGEYMTFLGERDGWRFWVGQNKYSTTCFAIKNNLDGDYPEPFAADYFYGDDAYAVIRYDDTSLEYNIPPSWDIATRHKASVRDEYRFEGEKFMRSFYSEKEQSFETLDGKVIEYSKFGYEYPNIKVGAFSAEGKVDFTGAANAAQSVKDCMTERAHQ